MRVQLTISNYRCLSEADPATLALDAGLTAVVGANNAGKSAVLRFFFELRPLFQALGDNESVLHNAVRSQVAFQSTLPDNDQLFHDGNVGDIVIVLQLDDPSGPSLKHSDKWVITIPRGTNLFGVEIHAAGSPIGPIRGWDGSTPHGASKAPLADIDPMLKAVRALGRIRVIGPRRAASSQATSYDFDGVTGSNLVSRWRTLKGGTKAGRLEATRVERQLSALFGLPGLAINQSENGQDLLVSYGDQSYQIEELGSGLAHFVVALVTLGSHPDTSWLLIDEPENGLHPTKQREYLRTLAATASEGVLFATHSYGLAKAVASTVYLVDRPVGVSHSLLKTPTTISSIAEFLGELGYSGYRDLGFDRLLLVEGPRDVRVLDEFKRLLPAAAEVLVLPLAGTNTINNSADQQLAELVRISQHVFALIDSEQPSKDAPIDPVRLAFKASCQKLGIECHILERRSLENYLSEAAVKAVLGREATALEPFELASDEVKGQQVKIAHLMNRAELADTDLWAFLQHVFA